MKNKLIKTSHSTSVIVTVVIVIILLIDILCFCLVLNAANLMSKDTDDLVDYVHEFMCDPSIASKGSPEYLHTLSESFSPSIYNSENRVKRFFTIHNFRDGLIYLRLTTGEEEYSNFWKDPITCKIHKEDGKWKIVAIEEGWGNIHTIDASKRKDRGTYRLILNQAYLHCRQSDRNGENVRREAVRYALRRQRQRVRDALRADE